MCVQKVAGQARAADEPPQHTVVQRFTVRSATRKIYYENRAVVAIQGLSSRLAGEHENTIAVVHPQG